MARPGSTTSARARQMRRVLARWKRSGLTLREFGERHGIALSTLSWWRQVFRRATEPEDSAPASAAAGKAVVFTEVPRPAPTLMMAPPVLEIVLRSGHVLRVPPGFAVAALRAVVAALAPPC